MTNATVFSNRLHHIQAFIERQMEGTRPYDEILRDVDEKLEKLRIDFTPTVAEKRERSKKAAICNYSGPIRTERLHALLKEICGFYGVPYAAVAGNSRTKHLAFARHVFFYLAVRRMGATTVEAGAFMGRDHSTVIYGVQRIENQRGVDEKLRAETEWFCIKCINTPMEVA